jgi:predicted PurR-regulated permease PerM
MLNPTRDEPTKAQTAARVVMALALTALGLWTLWEFIAALVWACILAIAVWPLYRRVQRQWPPGRHNLLLPSLFTLAIAGVFVIPLVVGAVRALHESHVIFDWIDTARRTGIPAPDWLAHLPLGAEQATAWWNENLSDSDAAADLLHRIDRAELVGAGRQFGAKVAHRIILFGFSLLTLFFLFRDGDYLAGQMQRASHRAFGPSGERVGRQIIASVHGTVDGLVLVGIGEGVLLGIAYAFAGVPHPTLLGAITAVAAMIPFGAPLIFGFAALLLVGQGSGLAAIVVLAVGMIVTFVADHFVRPVLIGGATKLPFLWVLFGILGGVATWGLLGLFLGPAIMAALILLWREWTSGEFD